MQGTVPTILERIVQDTKILVQNRKRDTPVSSLEAFPGFERSCLSLETALSAASFSIIAEAKKASPSKGIIRADFDPVAITTAYQNAGAAAVSILTEPLHFQGNIQYLTDCRPGLHIPILRKDFIVDSYQLWEAKAYGADAVLLIATILDAGQIRELQAAARDLGLSILLEVYEEAELERVDVDNTPVIGANSRNLHSFEVNLLQAIGVLKSLPGNIIRIAESGIKTPADLALLRDNGLDGALIGESLMKEPDPGAALTTLLSSMS